MRFGRQAVRLLGKGQIVVLTRIVGQIFQNRNILRAAKKIYAVLPQAVLHILLSV